MGAANAAAAPRTLLGSILAAAALVVLANTAEPADAPAPKADKDKVLYELGVQMSSGLTTFDLSESEFKIVMGGLIAGYHHRSDIGEAATYEPQMQALRSARIDVITQRQKDAGRAYFNKMASTSGAVTTPSGLLYISRGSGTGKSPAPNDQVQVAYIGRFIDGTVFDSSKERGGPTTLSLGLVMPCLSEALQRMQVGGKSRIVCPSDLAYGDRGSLPKIMPGATLEFDLKLLAINDSGKAAPSFELSDKTIDPD
jgi:FKBP-type peptidyl-prolyl cis-trans isomerase FkpA/FKBP-type peptidyl-prolyl cis-trans isomerase FklB